MHSSRHIVYNHPMYMLPSTELILVTPVGFEPTTPCLKGRCSKHTQPAELRGHYFTMQRYYFYFK